jgi:poly-gamma-glutamate synthesis protein (capsule biosynthesis protein)
VLALLSACTTTSPTWQSPDPTKASTATPTPTGPPTITLAFGGDVHFAERTLKLLDNPQTAFGPIAETLSAADIAMVNLETAVTERGTPEPKQFHFRAPATAYDALKAAGVDVATLANNHTLDYGRVGLDDTLNAAKQRSFPIVGAGENAAEAYAPWITEVKGVKIAFLGMSTVNELASTWVAKDNRSGLAMGQDQQRAVQAVRDAAAKADVVVVDMHWGTEYNSCPTAGQKSLAQALVDAGADIIVGSHVHQFQGQGWLGKTYVFYGMGNFLWWYNDAATNDTGVVRVTLHGTQIVKTEFLPAYIDRQTGQPKLVQGAEATRITKEVDDLHGCTGLAAEPS